MNRIEVITLAELNLAAVGLAWRRSVGLGLDGYKGQCFGYFSAGRNWAKPVVSLATAIGGGHD
jgi:hypothetical protein